MGDDDANRFIVTDFVEDILEGMPPEFVKMARTPSACHNCKIIGLGRLMCCFLSSCSACHALITDKCPRCGQKKESIAYIVVNDKK